MRYAFAHDWRRVANSMIRDTRYRTEERPGKGQTVVGSREQGVREDMGDSLAKEEGRVGGGRQENQFGGDLPGKRDGCREGEAEWTVAQVGPV
ncbi:hypothetical protein BDZ91DRAFT_797926 [Kalaharituber pfeilii]|nr:hypothetical protein BDZ91DRAFT_797926 [Kalaharituber pfeilii]